ncbi:MAG: TIGR02281 family clan AA aspartic protease [Methylophilaceae bacterium]|nr:TIGR02281 family clan AA aspartic protease [Methylophilaceae bacterium]
MQRTVVLWIFLLCALTGLLYIAHGHGFHKNLGFGNPASSSIYAISDLAEVCDEKPPQSGRVLNIDTRPNLRKSESVAGLDIVNQHIHPVFAILTNPRGDREYQGVFLTSGQMARMLVPAGEYGFTVLTGSQWCNQKVGFKDGQALEHPEALVLTKKSYAKMNFLPYGSAPESLIFSYAPAGLIATEGSSEMLELSRQIDGHFYIEGSVDGYPITFLIDTGATSVSIPYSVATAIGLDKNCMPVRFITAAGTVAGCKALAQQLSVGGFQFSHMEVGFNKGGDIPLLGMSVLSQFRVQQNGDTMLILRN